MGRENVQSPSGLRLLEMRCFLLAVLPAFSSLAATITDFNVESNALIPSEESLIPQQKKEPEATCDGNSICSFLQANNHGVNVVEYCKCKGFSECSTQWDPYDGKSITQAQSDQYKYCDAAPAVQKCSSTEEVAYTSVQIFRGETKIESSDKIHCVCPDGHNYLDTEYKFKEDGEISEMLVNYFCLPLPACNSSEVCKDVTVKPGQYIVNPKCLCENGLACPSVTKKGVTKTLLGANMELQQITCQEPMRATGRRLSDLYAPQQLAQLYRKHFGHQTRQWPQKRSARPSMSHSLWRK